MKFSKSLFLAFAGLGLFACSNEDVTNGGNNLPNKEVIVGVNIVTDGSRIVTEPIANDANVKVNTLTLTLEAMQGGKTVNFPIKSIEEAKAAGLEGEDYDDVTDDYFTKSAIQQVNEYKFVGVRNPSKMTLSINNGKNSAYALSEIYNVGLAAPMFEEVDITSNMYDAPNNLYTILMRPAHRIALLQFSDISHQNPKAGESCWFSSIHFDGLFLNKIEMSEGEGVYLDVNNWEEAQVPSTTFDIVDEDFEIGKIWPANDESSIAQCYAYNVFPSVGDKKPILTLCFSDIELTKGQWVGADKKGYATVSKYVTEEGDEITEFKPGYIYRFTNLAVPDSAIGSGIDGSKDAEVIAIVNVTPWTLINGTVEW